MMSAPRVTRRVRRSTRERRTYSLNVVSPRGFTILEVLIGVLVLSIGIIGIFAMQLVAISTNRTAYDFRMATELAETTLERMRMDSIEWQSAGQYPVGTWLERGLETVGNWTTPPLPSGVAGGNPTYNDLGLPYAPSATAVSSTGAPLVERNSKFCIEYRLQWLRLTTDYARAEVRVTWARSREGEAILSGDCGALATVEEVQMRRHFNSVQVTGLVQQNQVVR